MGSTFLNNYNVAYFKYEYCRKSLEFFRGPKYEGLDEELNQIITSNETKAARSSNSLKASISKIFSAQFGRPFLSIGILYIIYQSSGFQVVPAYAETFFEHAHAGTKLVFCFVTKCY